LQSKETKITKELTFGTEPTDPETDHIVLDKPPKAFHKEKSPNKKDPFKEYIEKINV